MNGGSAAGGGHDGPAQAHYGRLAASYDQNWAYSPAYIAWMTRSILDRAAVQPGEIAADIGCGTGLYSRGLATAAGMVICADPSQAMLSQLPAGPALVPVAASAQDVAARRVQLPADRLDVIVMKEAIHHVPATDRPATLRGLAGLLPPGGRIVIVMLPARISYPLFTAALDRFGRLQPGPATIAAMLSEAGLDTELTYGSYQLSFPKDRYLAMVRDRYMSLLATFSDAEIGRGIAEIQDRYPGDRLEFPDTFAFIRGIRDPAVVPGR
ncbi:MAG TPA: methyltransferase domain-containing protein [Streptosporangiaceae bacterium]|jgi:SAM-dependent methyltransferase